MIRMSKKERNMLMEILMILVIIILCVLLRWLYCAGG